LGGFRTPQLIFDAIKRSRLRHARTVTQGVAVPLGVCLVGLLLLALFLSPEQSRAAAPLDIAPGCINLIDNGGFEVIGPQWLIQGGDRPPMYTNEVTFNNSQQSLRIGNGEDLANIPSVSEVRYLPLQFPPDATRLILRFRYFPRYEASPGQDLQQVDLYYQNTDQLALSLLNAQENSDDWRLVERDLTEFRGQLLSLRFRVRNDGADGRTWMYLDQVELEYCSLTPLPSTPIQTPSPTLWPPTALPTDATTPAWPTKPPCCWPPATGWSPAPTSWPPATNWPPATSWPPPPTLPSTPVSTLPPPPPGCADILANGGFESWGNWYVGEDPVPPRYVSEPVYSGARSMLLGNPPGGGPNVTTYSSIRQLVMLPPDLQSAELRWWQLSYTEEPPNPNPSVFEDREDVILLTPDLGVIAVLLRERSNVGVWQQRSLDLTPYRGQPVFIYFNIFNNDDPARTWMYLDDVALFACGAGAPLGEIQPYGAPGAFEAQPLPVEPQFALPQQAAPLPTQPLPQEEPQQAAPPPMQALPPAPTPLPVDPTATPVAQAQPESTVTPGPTATPQGALVAILTTPTTVDGVTTPARITVSVSDPTQQPWWRRVLGPIALMCSIPLLIGLIIVLVIQISRLGRPRSTA
jgi:hypothetical protein